MNEKILPDDIESKSLSELTDIADRLIQELESKKNLEESFDDYQYLIKLNNLIIAFFYININFTSKF